MTESSSSAARLEAELLSTALRLSCAFAMVAIEPTVCEAEQRLLSTQRSHAPLPTAPLCSRSTIAKLRRSQNYSLTDGTLHLPNRPPCAVRRFTADEARKCLAKRRVVFVGDSTLQELANELLATLAGHAAVLPGAERARGRRPAASIAVRRERNRTFDLSLATGEWGGSACGGGPHATERYVQRLRPRAAAAQQGAVRCFDTFLTTAARRCRAAGRSSLRVAPSICASSGLRGGGLDTSRRRAVGSCSSPRCAVRPASSSIRLRTTSRAGPTRMTGCSRRASASPHLRIRASTPRRSAASSEAWQRDARPPRHRPAEVAPLRAMGRRRRTPRSAADEARGRLAPQPNLHACTGGWPWRRTPLRGRVGLILSALCTES